MKRTSFVAPLLLIGVGSVFLARNLYPELPLNEYVGQYWPWVLIAWGGLRLFEILLLRVQGKPLPSRGISGGEWVLVVFLCLFGSGLHASQGFVKNGGFNQFRIRGLDVFGEPFEYPVETEKPSSQSPHIVLENFHGDAHLMGVDAINASGRIKVTGHKTIRNFARGEADRLNENSSIEIAGDANNVIIRTRQGASFVPRSVSFTLEISVPKGSSVETRDQGGDLTMENLTSVALDSDRGDVRLKNINGTAHVTLRRGDVHLEAARVPGEIEISSGDFSGSNVVGPLKLSARSQDVKLDESTGAVDIQIARGDISLRPSSAGGTVQAHTRSGDISVALPAATGINLSATTSRGDVSSEFNELKAETNGRHGELKGTIGGGTSNKTLVIDLQTDRGDIAVRKAGAEITTEVLKKLDQ